ncbi:MAG TPA: putative beta-lysine N-acetyltransferase [Geopsychrobacteraceae bacterium]|nr:putative beta-lysine N-acetyltransferase [Geopsychrobacteraceae bacterium]
MKIDHVELYGKSTIQHGLFNDRVYLMNLDRDDFPHVIAHIGSLVALNGYSKAFVKVPEFARDLFEEYGYRVEATIPGLYNGKDDGHFMARYFHAHRLIDHSADIVQQVLVAAREKATDSQTVKLPQACECRLAKPSDCTEVAQLYATVFKTYPFPIHDPDYLHETMDDNVIYAGIWKQDQLLAIASAEVDSKSGNAELTDFATLPDWRGHGLANVLLNKLEDEMASAGIKTCYTIARATSFGMNICFARNGYGFCGTLTKNTQISGGLESMNVWFKRMRGGQT